MNNRGMRKRAGRGSRFLRSGNYGSHYSNMLKSEINVTPFVDVMLVLLIVFMITSPMMISGVELVLPYVDTAGSVVNKQEPIVISVDKNGSIYLESQKDLPLQSIKTKLNYITKSQPNTDIFIRGDKDANYGQIMSVFDILKDVGASNISLITLSDEVK